MTVSKLELAREALKAKHSGGRERFIDLDSDGILVAEVGLADSRNGARAMRVMASIMTADADVGAEEMARLIGETTVALHTRVDGELEPITHEDGTPLKFDARFGEAWGEPSVTDTLQAVLLVFTETPEGQMAQVNGASLASVATVFAGVLNGSAAPGKDASDVVGEPGGRTS